MAQDEIIRHRIRMARSKPPGRCERSAARRKTFSAALQQFDELMRAAEVTGPAARPLPLFYALSQAGRAIAAAHADTDWQPHGHGLGFETNRDAILQSRVWQKGGDTSSFRMVSGVAAGGEVPEPVELGALLSSLPDLDHVHLRLQDPWPQTLALRPYEPDSAIVLRLASARIEAEVEGFTDIGSSEEETRAAVARQLAPYPTTAGWELVAHQGIVPRRRSRRAWILRLAWHAKDTSPVSRQRRLDEVAPEYRFEGSRWIRPGLGEHLRTLSPLMTWWAALYGLSTLARYEPRTWVAALDLDSSELAATFDIILEQAMRAVPHLVHEALYGEPFLLPDR